MDLNTSIAASRLIAQQHAMDVTANNLANANTPGFKREQTQFGDWLSKQNGVDVPPGGRVLAYTQDLSTWRDLQQGALSHTGNTYDLALTSDGYFTVNTPRGVRLTRDGRFNMTPDGTLADSNGDPVLDSNSQPILIPPGTTNLTIAGDGTLSGDTGPLGKLGVVKPNDPAKLQAEGATLLNAPSGTVSVSSPGVVQGTLEESNVQPVLELTRMMNDSKEFQFVSQYVQSESDRQQSAIDKLLPANS